MNWFFWTIFLNCQSVVLCLKFETSFFCVFGSCIYLFFCLMVRDYYFMTYFLRSSFCNPYFISFWYYDIFWTYCCQTSLWFDAFNIRMSHTCQLLSKLLDVSGNVWCIRNQIACWSASRGMSNKKACIWFGWIPKLFSVFLEKCSFSNIFNRNFFLF